MKVEVETFREWIENWIDKEKYYHPFSRGKTIPISELYDLIDQLCLYESVMEKEKKYKILDQLAEEAEESRSEYRRWKNEKNRD